MVALPQLLDMMERAGEDEVRDAIVCLVAELRLSTFVKHCWHVHHEAEPLGWNWHIDCICDHLEATLDGDIVWLLINIAPGFMKSLLCSVYFPAWVWLKYPWFRWLCSSTNEIVTLRDARKHKELITSPWYQRVFQPDWGILKTQSADGNFGTTRHGERVSRTVNSSIIGSRPHGRILDDANDPKSTTEDYAKVNFWLEDTYFKRRAKLHPESFIVNVHQRTGELDSTGYMMSREIKPKHVHLVLPNRYVPQRSFHSMVFKPGTLELWEDPRTEVDELLHTLILDEAKTAEERAAPGGEAIDAAQNQQDPTPRGGIIFKRSAFQRWSPAPNIEEWRKLPAVPDFERGYYPTYPLPDKFDLLLITVDPNNLKDGKATRNTDYVVIDIWGRVNNLYYLVAQIRQKLGVAGTIAAVHQAVKLHHLQVAAVLVESKANGPTIINGLRAIMGIAAEEKLPETQQFVRKWNVQGETKTQRARGISYVVDGGRVFIPCEREHGYYVHWLNEICGFPNKVRDDCVDTMTMALTFFEKERQFG